MSFDDFRTVLRQYDELVAELKKSSGDKIIANLHITGGEPFLHSEIGRILRYLSWRSHKYKLAFMTNGTLLSPALIRKLKRLGIKPLQLSLDGGRRTHDSIRSQGNFDKVIGALDMLYKHGMSSRVSFTAHKDNFRELVDVAQICREHHVSSLWSDRFVPCSRKNVVTALDADDMREYVEMLRALSSDPLNDECKMHIQNFRSLQFLGSDDKPYYCRAGEDFLAVDELGNILPCRRLPIVCGNIHSDGLKNVFMNSAILDDLRRHKFTGKCVNCEHSKECMGGARCMSYAVLGDYNAPDPCCFIEG